MVAMEELAKVKLIMAHEQDKLEEALKQEVSMHKSINISRMLMNYQLIMIESCFTIILHSL